MNEDGAEQLYVTHVDEPVANVGVSILTATPGSLVDPWLLGSNDENDVQGYAGTPDRRQRPHLRRADRHRRRRRAIFPRQQRFYVAVDSGRDPFTGNARSAGRYLLNSWVNDVTPPFVQLITQRVAAGRPP